MLYSPYFPWKCIKFSFLPLPFFPSIIMKKLHSGSNATTDVSVLLRGANFFSDKDGLNWFVNRSRILLDWIHRVHFYRSFDIRLLNNKFHGLSPSTLYWNRFCIVIWGCYSQNDRFVQNWIQGLLWYHIRSGKLPKATFVTKKLLETDRIG